MLTIFCPRNPWNGLRLRCETQGDSGKSEINSLIIGTKTKQVGRKKKEWKHSSAFPFLQYRTDTYKLLQNPFLSHHPPHQQSKVNRDPCVESTEEEKKKYIQVCILEDTYWSDVRLHN